MADAVQDTFVAVWQKPGGFRGDGDVAAWLWGIASRRLVSRLRRRIHVAAGFEIPGTVQAAEDEVLPAVEYGDLENRSRSAAARGRRGTTAGPTRAPVASTVAAPAAPDLMRHG